MRPKKLTVMAAVAAVLAGPAAVHAKTAIVSIRLGSTGSVCRGLGGTLGYGTHPVIAGHGAVHGIGRFVGRAMVTGPGLSTGHHFVSRSCGSSALGRRMFSSVSRTGLFGSFAGLSRTTLIRSGHHGTTLVVSRSVASPLMHRTCVTQVVTRPVPTHIVRQPVATCLVTQPAIRQVVVESPVVSVWITNSNGSKTEVKLTRSGPGYIGPRGEYYTGMPNNEQLRMVYGF